METRVADEGPKAQNYFESVIFPFPLFSLTLSPFAVSQGASLLALLLARGAQNDEAHVGGALHHTTKKRSGVLQAMLLCCHPLHAYLGTHP